MNPPDASALVVNRATLFLREEISALWGDQNPLEAAFALSGEVYRDVPGRRTLSVQVGGRDYFVKLHYGVGWGEMVKNWLQLKVPVVGARNEFVACRALEEEGLTAPRAAAFAESTARAAQRHSFVMCDALVNYLSLEDVTDAWSDAAPSKLLRHRLLDRVARFARRFHGAGFIHRDFYICHLLVRREQLQAELADPQAELAVLDLHRARRFEDIPERWLKRDLAALLFSTLDLGYTRRDWWRFIALYSGRSVREELRERGAFWRAVLKRAEKLYREGQRKGIVKGRYVA